MLHKFQASILAWWRRRWGRRADEVARQYRIIGEALRHNPLALADLADLAQAQASTHVPGDPCTSAFNEGRRALFNHLMEAARLSDLDVRAAQAQGRPRAEDFTIDPLE